MFDVQSLPGEATTAIDWAKMQSDFEGVCAERVYTERAKTEQVGASGQPMYPIFEVAVWELEALHNLLVALDQRHATLESNLYRRGSDRQNGQLQLEQAENALCEARAEFLEAFIQLNREKSGEAGSAATSEKNAFNAINVLWELEAVWRSHRPQASLS